MRKSLWAVLADLQTRGLYIRDGSDMVRPLDWFRWHPSKDALVARYQPLSKPGKPLDYATKVGDVFVSGGTVLHVYKPEGKGPKERDKSNDDWARD